MKAVFVESSNGYMAKSETDDMSWTPSLDKKIFRLLTYSFGGVCVCSRRTYNLLPAKMLSDGRNFIVAEKAGTKSLVELNKAYPSAVLVGGATFLRAAYDLGVVDTFVVTTTANEIPADERFKNPFSGVLKQPNCVIRLDNLTIRVYNQAQIKERQ